MVIYVTTAPSRYSCFLPGTGSLKRTCDVNTAGLVSEFMSLLGSGTPMKQRLLIGYLSG